MDLGNFVWCSYIIHTQMLVVRHKHEIEISILHKTQTDLRMKLACFDPQPADINGKYCCGSAHRGIEGSFNLDNLFCKK